MCVGGDFGLVEAERLDPRLLDQARARALRQRGADVAATIGGGARPGDEAIARADTPAVGLQLAAHVLAQPASGLLATLKAKPPAGL